MAKGWTKYKLSDLGFLGRGKSKHRPRNDESLFGGKYPFIQTGEIKATNLYISDYEQTYNEKGLAQSKLWNENTLCMTIAANIAETAILKIKACFPDSVVGFVADDKLCNVFFIKYYIDFIKNRMQSVSGGACQDNLSLDKIAYFDIEAPKREMQDKIAKVLSNYDDLIENNNKRIKILEEMAQKIYKEWFVDFKFPGHETATFKQTELGKIPSDWVHKPIDSLLEHQIGGGWGNEEKDAKYAESAYVIRGADIPNGRDGNIQNCPLRYHTSSNIKTRLLQINDIVFEVSGGSKGQPVGRSLLLNKNLFNQFNDNVICASFCKLLRPDVNQILPELVYLHLLNIYNNGEIEKYQTQSTGIINFKFTFFLESERVLVPNYNIQELFKKIIVPIFDEISLLGYKNQTLKQTRDLLLPRLISGEIDVENLEIA